MSQTRKTAGTSYPEVPGRFRLFPHVGQGVGQDKKRATPGRASTKSKPEIYPQYPFLYAEPE